MDNAFFVINDTLAFTHIKTKGRINSDDIARIKYPEHDRWQAKIEEYK